MLQPTEANTSTRSMPIPGRPLVKIQSASTDGSASGSPSTASANRRRASAVRTNVPAGSSVTGG